MPFRNSARVASGAALLLLPAAAIAASPGDDPLGAGWNRTPERAALRLRLGKTALRGDLRQEIAGPATAGLRVSTAAPPTPGRDGVLAVGDALGISQDDGFVLAPGFSWEGRLAARSGAAGASDYLAFRVAAQQFAYRLPVDVTGVDLGFDNRHGRATWPLIGLKAESATQPLQPLSAWLAQVTAFAAPAGLPAPVVSPGPDVFQRLPVVFPAPVTVSWTPTVDDGMWSDRFDRAVDENLDHPASDWSECDRVGCGLNKRLTVRSMTVVKSLGGDALGVKFPAASVIARRPVTDLDGIWSVYYDVTAGSAASAGLLVRLESLDRFYFVEYQKGANQIVLSAMTPGGLVPLSTAPPPGMPYSGTLRVEVRGAHPSVSIQVFLGATSVLSHTDSTYAYTGVLSGVGNFGASTGEVWDDFQVLRQPDLFVLAQIPPGVDAGLPAEWSPSSVGFGNVLSSTDGSSFANVPAGSGCVKAPNGFAQLRVASDTNLFQIESKLVELGISCPTCPETRNLCAEDVGPADLRLPVFEVGQPLRLSAGWWNEHAPDEAFLTLQFQLWQGGCSDPGAVLVDSQNVAIGLTPGQRSSVQPVLSQVSAPLSFSPVAPGDYCAWVIELYDRNADSCFDGYEGSPCPFGCTCVNDPDENASTGVLARALKVTLPCLPLTTSELVPASLRAAKDPLDALGTRLHWSVSGSSFRLFNIQMTTSRIEVGDPAIRDSAPTFTRLLGGLPDTDTIQALPAVPGGVLYFAVFQNDGCSSGWSLQDP